MDDDPVTIKQYLHVLDAQLDQHRLLQEGIESHLADENISTIHPFYSFMLGGARLQVKASDLERALEVIGSEPEAEVSETASGRDLREQEEGEVEWVTCPSCGSGNVEVVKISGAMKVLSIVLLGLPLPFIKRNWKCGSCGNTWKTW